jgi:hypothetical protein
VAEGDGFVQVSKRLVAMPSAAILIRSCSRHSRKIARNGMPPLRSWPLWGCAATGSLRRYRMAASRANLYQARAIALGFLKR